MFESEFLYRRKTVTDNIVINFESFKHGNTEESIQVSNCKENLKGAIYLITEQSWRQQRDFKRSLESESNIHNDGDNILNFSSYLEEIRIQSPDTGIISEQTMQ